EELLAEERRSPWIPRQRGERRNLGEGPALTAEVRLDAPDRRQRARRDAVLLSDLLDQGAMLRVFFASLRDPLRRQDPRDVGIERQRHLGLRPVALNDGRDRLVNVRQCLI